MIEQLIDILVQFVTSVISAIGYPGIVLLMGLESANIPIPSEAIMPFAGFLVAEGRLNFWVVVLMGTLGNWAGSSLSWWLGATGGRALVDKYGRYVRLSHHHLDVAERWFAKYGEASVFFGRLLPVVRTFISLPAGLAKMNYIKFSIYTILGALPFCYVLTLIGFKLGERWDEIRRYFHYLDAIVVVGLILAVGYWYLRKRNSKLQAKNSK